MADFYFENQGTNTYLVYEIKPDDAVDSMSLGMLTNNIIPGLASAVFTQINTTKYIKYNVSAKISVKQFFEGQVNKKRLLGVFNGIVDAMLSAEDYMIDTNTVLLDLNYIFADVSTCDTVLVCLPIIGQGTGVDLSTFFKAIMFSTQFDQTENCDHVARIINYLNSTPVFSLADFKSILDSLNGTAQPAPQPVVQSAPQPVVQPAPQTAVQPAPQPAVQPASKSAVSHSPKHARPEPAPVTQMPPQVNVPQPPSKKKGFVQPEQPAQSVQPEKKISMFGLLMHYNKENKELYRSQKAAKKSEKGAEAFAPGPAPTPAPAPKKAKKQAVNNGFAVPGSASSGGGFAVPGAPSNTGFAVPGSPAAAPSAQPASVQARKPVEKPAVKPVAERPVSQPVQPAYIPPVNPQGQAANFGETTVLGGGGNIGETTVLSGGSPEVQMCPHLVRTKNNENINLNKPVFRIGKERSYVDYFVSDNTAVSRSHANIITRDGQYYIVDTNSTNHTYVNGGMIQSNVETPLSHGAKIRLANEEFEFRLY